MRYALVGTGSRAEMFTQALAATPGADLVALCDTNPVRIAAHQRLLASIGATVPAAYPAGEFEAMLAKEKVDTVVVTTVDATHERYIVAALDAGCDVLTEKPMTTTAPAARRILDAVERSGHSVAVTFNYRFNPVHEQVKRLLAEGAIGDIGSVHFEWLLDVRHGADYFRRWHREKENSGGLLVHKSGHHFDLVNWWLAARPVTVYAQGGLFFYGAEGRRRGYARDYDRAHGSAEAKHDPFALHLADHPRLRELYLDAESADGYLRDRNVFADGISIEDDLAVLVRYDTGATMSYHLTAYAPWEGYRIAFNGSRGRLELDVVESDHVSLATASALKGAALHGAEGAAEAGSVSLRLRQFWTPPVEILRWPEEVPLGTPGTDAKRDRREGHGGADARMTGVLFGGQPDPMNRSATARDGALALLTGVAANESLRTGGPVRVADLLQL